MIMNKINKYGWTPDLPDFNDFKLKQITAPVTVIPDKVDLRPLCSAVENQQDLGSCTANALAASVEYLLNRDKKAFFDVSRLFIYYNERAMEGNVGQDSGAQLRDGIKTMAKYGVCKETLWPYVPQRFTKKPSRVCYAQAKNYHITAYARLNTLNDMLSCLASGFPFVFGFSVYESFESSRVASSGVVQLPVDGEQQLGGHAVCAVGYDKTVDRFIVRNSWGETWGMKGYFTMPFDYLTNRDLSDDFWVIKMGDNM
jgi:C1A family cysteine protease